MEKIKVEEGKKKRSFFQSGWCLVIGIVLMLVGGIGFFISINCYPFRLLGLLMFCLAAACLLIGLILACESARVRDSMP